MKKERTQEENDFVDRFYDFLCKKFAQFKEYDEKIVKDIKEELRAEFGGEFGYVRQKDTKNVRAKKIMALFNGKNTREIARELNISESTVRRVIKQPGGIVKFDFQNPKK